jgi:hypothetical protein
MLQFAFATAGPEDILLREIAITASGSGDDSTDVQAVRLVLDANANGTVDQGELVLGSGTFTADNGAMTIVLAPPRTIPGSTSETYLIVYDFAPVSGSALPAAAVVLVAALVGAIRTRGGRRHLVILIGVVGLCVLAACSDPGEESGDPSSIAATYQLTLTGVVAEEESSGGAVVLSGFPLVGPVVAVR